MPYTSKDSVRPDYTPNEYARRFNISPATVRTKISRGQIPSYRVGGSRRIPASYVDSILNPTEELDAAIKRIVDAAPKLTAAQRDKLGTLLADDDVPQRQSA
ncbi:hypothetical protein A5647_04960 [Mycobacterium sp. 1100029.7]|nr:hypothetical protein A5647_04960 [Mycobacterium sp. 1100029.7]